MHLFWSQDTFIWTSISGEKSWVGTAGSYRLGVLLNPCHLLNNPVLCVVQHSDKSKRRTKAVKKTCEPKWNQTFVYTHVHRRDFRNHMLELTIWDQPRSPEEDSTFMGEVPHRHTHKRTTLSWFHVGFSYASSTNMWWCYYLTYNYYIILFSRIISQSWFEVVFFICSALMDLN